MLLVVGAIVGTSVASQIVIPLLSKAAQTLTQNVELVGLPLTLLALAAIGAAVPAGKTADRLGRKITSAASVMLLTIGLGVTAWTVEAGEWTLFLLGNTLVGFGYGAANVLTILAVTDLFPRERRGEATGFAFFGAALGPILGPLIGGSVGDIHGLGVTFSVAGVWAVLSCIALLCLNIEPREVAANLERYFPEAQTDIEGNGGAARTREARPLLQLFSLYPVQVQFWSRILIHAPRIFILVVAPMTLGAAGYSLTYIGTLLMMMGTGLLVVALPAGRWADQYSRKAVVLAGAFVSLLALVGQALTPHPVFLAVVFFLVGAGFSAVNTVAPIIVADVTNPIERGKAMGLFGIATGAGGVLFPVTFGWLYGTYGLKYVMAIVVGLMLAILILAALLAEPAPGQYRKSSLP